MTDRDANSVATAVASARRALGIDSREPVQTWSVAPLHSGSPEYVLVVFGAAERAIAIATVDANAGEVLESARLPGRGAHAPMSAAEAIRRTGLGQQAEARLVWSPSAASRSRFYPLWEIKGADRTIWVDSIGGEVWRTLEATRGGGGARVPS
jgi:hypothetical protein